MGLSTSIPLTLSRTICLPLSFPLDAYLKLCWSYLSRDSIPSTLFLSYKAKASMGTGKLYTHWTFSRYQHSIILLYSNTFSVLSSILKELHLSNHLSLSHGKTVKLFIIFFFAQYIPTVHCNCHHYHKQYVV